MSRIKLKYLFLVAALCMASLSVDAQNPSRKDAVSFKVLFMDYQSPQTGNYGNLSNYTNGLEISYQRSITDYLNVSVPFRAGVVNFNDDFKNEMIVGLGGQAQAQLFRDGAPAIPYALLGAQAVFETNNSAFGLEIPIGVGVDLKMGKNAYFNVQLEYHLGLSDMRSNLTHGIGFKYLLGNRSEAEQPLQEVDFDKDGVPDETDNCPDVAGLIELNGCPDTDGDGVPDNEDQCPDFAGSIEMNGCPDSDGDGVSDNDDECPNLAGLVTNNGCPSEDQDGDGVIDSEDQCPNLKGSPDNRGCPQIDKDGDGVNDDLDRCPDLPGSIETNGCPDADGDGVYDADDLCPNDAGLKRFNGCPDQDGDGVHDGIDRCPGTIGLATNEGCPVVKREVRELLDFAQRAVQFDVGKSTLKSESNPILDQIVQILRSNPDYGIAISGHTDSTGETYKNLDLSETRAKACYDYLINKGVSSDRLNYVGYGEARPIATNATNEGRRLNRRVEFEVKFK